ncbi:MAG: DUF1684 domain-containing protein [Cyclobacteriaceae bacterium]|nr:DUF1684 domain-containing protein [Cyclobacteriaceae bacterium]
MKTLSLVLLCCACSYAQTDQKTALAEIKTFQEELNQEYKDKKKSPLLSADLKKFKKHEFFPVDLKYRVEAKLTLTPETSFAPMKATQSLVQDYRVYGTATFTIDGMEYSLPVYQSKNLLNNPKYPRYLFLPFGDLTNGTETYGGGRYLNLQAPEEGDVLIIDFNKAYSPYCAYNPRYSCPLIPEENQLPVAIQAGVKYVGKK